MEIPSFFAIVFQVPIDFFTLSIISSARFLDTRKYSATLSAILKSSELSFSEIFNDRPVPDSLGFISNAGESIQPLRQKEAMIP